METLVNYWQFTLVAGLIIIAWVVNTFIDKTSSLSFGQEGMPSMRPVPIETKSKGFWGGIWMWLMATRRWEITEDFYYNLNGEQLVIPKGFSFDGASIPKFLRTWLAPMGVLLVGGLIHDYGYKYATLLKANKGETLGSLTQKDMDVIFRDINVEVNGFIVLNYVAYYALRLGGFAAWRGHRKTNATLGDLKN